MLTLGIPTFNRKDTIVKNVNYIIENSIHNIIHVLIIDNASDDGSFESLSELCRGTTIRLLRNCQNIGFTGSFLRLFEECDTEYLMISSDEDYLVKNKLMRIKTYLNNTCPAFVSPQVFRNKRLYRGRKRVQEIEPGEFRSSSFYISGLIYNVPSSRSAISSIRKHICKDGQAYPQILLTATLMTGHRCMWLDMPMTQIINEIPIENELSKHGTYDPKKGKWQGIYTSVLSRWHQHEMIEDFFRDLKNMQSGMSEKRIVSRMLAAHENTLFDMMRFGIMCERNDLISVYDRGARRFFLTDLLHRVKKSMPYLRTLPIPIFMKKLLKRD